MGINKPKAPPRNSTHCDACGRPYTYGCGHSGTQQHKARLHNASKMHRAGKCEHFDHRDCDPLKCRRGGHEPMWPGLPRHLDVKWWRVVRVNNRTGEATRMCQDPLLWQEAEELLSRMTPHPDVTYELQQAERGK